jgi:hypothetical protein
MVSWRKCWQITVLLLMLVTGCTSAAKFDKVYTRISLAHLQPGQAIPTPQTATILTVTGKIGAPNAANQIVMDLETTEAVGQVEYTITDPFENRKIVYRGVLMRDLLDLWKVDQTATTLHIVALNDYNIDLPIAELREYPVLLAFQADGQYMQPDYHGPSMVIYPLDAYQLDPVATLKKLIWQVKTIDVQ